MKKGTSYADLCRFPDWVKNPLSSTASWGSDSIAIIYEIASRSPMLNVPASATQMGTKAGRDPYEGNPGYTMARTYT